MHIFTGHSGKFLTLCIFVIHAVCIFLQLDSSILVFPLPFKKKLFSCKKKKNTTLHSILLFFMSTLAWSNIED